MTTRPRPTATPDDPTPVLALQAALLLLAGAALGALLAAVLLPRWLPDLAASLVGSSPKAYWYLSRASGLVAYLLIWLSVALGLLITGKLARLWPGGPTTVDLHQFSGLLGLAFAIFHALILLGDRYVGYTPLQLLLPFAGGDYRPLAVGLGQVAFYLGALVGLSFYVRRRIGYRVWRLLHFGSFAVYVLATVHGLTAGTDADSAPVLALYGATALATLFLTVFRILMAMGRRQPGYSR
ncbi:MAG TPA: ferric reductase-like transmembrane domain-containing protein [Chloroflexota bacterium]|nr:ferric reductase-like transmembrane domain-containing protein [Chloroflexota bacterium]